MSLRPRYSLHFARATALAALIIGAWSCALPARAQPATPTPAAPTSPPPVPTELRSDHLEMVSTDTETTAIATRNVILTGTNLRITCDRLLVIGERLGDSDENAALPADQRFKYILATGNVRIVQGDRESTSQRAEVFPREDKVVLTEDPVILDHSSGFAAAGEKITLFRGKREVLVEKPRFTGPPIGDLSATAPARPATPPPAQTTPTAQPARPARPAQPAPAPARPADEPPPAVNFPRPGGR
jgi:lipopolysaccharide export system protein LptA